MYLGGNRRWVPLAKSTYFQGTLCYLLQFNGKRFHVSDKYKGIAIRTVCKRVKDPIQDRPPSKKYSYHKN